MHSHPIALAALLLATLIACAGREETSPPRTVAIAEAPSHSTSRDTALESTALPIDAGTSNVADAGAAQVFHLSHADRIPKLAGKHACFRSHAPGAVPPLTPHGAAACAKGARALELIETELVGIEDINDADDRVHAPPDPQRLLQTANLYSEWECSELRSGWTTVKLREVSEDISYGFTASASDVAVGPKMLRITDIQDNRVEWASVPRCECPQPAKHLLRAGDIVIARTGATTGKSFLIREVPEPFVFAYYLIRVQPTASVTPEYLASYMQ